MFRIKNNVYATQFHPEADPSVFQMRIDYYKHNGYFPADEADELKAAVAGQETPYAKQILKRFIDIYHRQSA